MYIVAIKYKHNTHFSYANAANMYDPTWGGGGGEGGSKAINSDTVKTPCVET